MIVCIPASLLLLAAPFIACADPLAVPDVDLSTVATYNSGTTTGVSAVDSRRVPAGSDGHAEVLVSTQDLPFPNQPTGQSHGFASSSVDAHGSFGVGVNGFFSVGVLPPNALFASGSFAEFVTNTTGDFVTVDFSLSVPAPTLRFVSVGNGFPPGADPSRATGASAGITVASLITRADSSIERIEALDYSFAASLDPLSGVFVVFASRDAVGSVSRFDEADGSFGFRLSPLLLDFGSHTLAPGDSFVFRYDYFAQARTGLGETGVLATIGDPFDLSAGGSFTLQLGAPVSTPVPESASWALLSAGLAAFACLGRLAAKRRATIT